ncbi:MAG: hypothetical protein COV35_01070 [Alphaproteobacteria bacterium CG11_big_fil_rev_8_21_14_0_20_39_49]|nr:MAG: hypothetical protein COV35_01070 [Alphaproteobacteria bacterium CG11_big_fil_rev_8_21_14_0_20_39_49]
MTKSKNTLPSIKEEKEARDSEYLTQAAMSTELFGNTKKAVSDESSRNSRDSSTEEEKRSESDDLSQGSAQTPPLPPGIEAIEQNAKTPEITENPTAKTSTFSKLNIFGKRTQNLPTDTSVAPRSSEGEISTSENSNNSPKTTPERQKRPLGSRLGLRKKQPAPTTIENVPDDVSTASRNEAGNASGIASTTSNENTETVAETKTVGTNIRELFRRRRQTVVATPTPDFPEALGAFPQTNEEEISVSSGQRSNRSATASDMPPAVETGSAATDDRSRYQKALDRSQDISGLTRFRKPGSAESGIGNGALLKAIPQAAVNLFDATLRGTTAVGATALVIPAALLLDAPAAIQKRIANRQERARGGNPENVQDTYVSSALIGTALNQGGKALKSSAYAVGTGVTAAVGTPLAAGIGIGAAGVGAGVVGAAAGVAAGAVATGTALGAASVPLSGVAGGIAGGASGLVKGGIYEGVKGTVKGASEGVEEATRAIRGNTPLYERKDQIRNGEARTDSSEDRGTLAKIAKSPLSAISALGSALVNSLGNSWKAIVKGPVNAVKGAIKNETAQDKLSRQVGQLSEQNLELRNELEALRTFQEAGRRVGTLTTVANAFTEAGQQAQRNGNSDEISLGSVREPTTPAIDNTTGARTAGFISFEEDDGRSISSLDNALPKLPKGDFPPLEIGVPKKFKMKDPTDTYAATLEQERSRSNSPEGRIPS